MSGGKWGRWAGLTSGGWVMSGKGGLAAIGHTWQDARDAAAELEAIADELQRIEGESRSNEPVTITLRRADAERIAFRWANPGPLLDIEDDIRCLAETVAEACRTALNKEGTS